MKREITVAVLANMALSAAMAAGVVPPVQAQKSGCMTCHQVEPGGKGPDGLAPIGPAWREVAAKYKGQPGAAEKLTHTVLTGSNPYDSHWKGKVSGLAMPPNAVAIKEADAKALVKWILALDTAPKK
jgi:cytochrome c